MYLVWLLVYEAALLVPQPLLGVVGHVAALVTRHGLLLVFEAALLFPQHRACVIEHSLALGCLGRC